MPELRTVDVLVPVMLAEPILRVERRLELERVPGKDSRNRGTYLVKKGLSAGREQHS